MADKVIAQNELEAIGLRVVQAFNERDFAAGMALAHPEIVAMPSRAHSVAEGYRGHDGLRAWFATLADREPWLEVVVASMHVVERRRGDRRDGTEPRGADARDADTRRAPPAEARTEERRQTDAHKLAMFGEMCLDGEPLGPWAAVLIIQDGLVIRQRSYHSTQALLEEIGVVARADGPPLSTA